MSLIDLLAQASALATLPAADASTAVLDRVRLAYQARSSQVLLPALTSAGSDNDKVVQLKSLLADNWRLIQGTMLSYTALATADSSALWYATAVCVHQHMRNTEQASDSALTWLTPGLYTASLAPEQGYPDLQPTSVEELQCLFNTHLEGEQGYHLVPVRYQTHYQVEQPAAARHNFYFDVTRTEEPDYMQRHQHVTAAEMARLRTHSEVTRQLADSLSHLHRCQQSGSNLLVQLQQLLQCLHRNDAHAGIGQETSAGQGAYGGIVAFFAYYQSLLAEEKARIPQALRDHIEQFKTVASDPDTNGNTAGQSNIATCLGNLKEKLQDLVQGERAALAMIGVSDAQKRHDLEQAEQRVTAHRQALQTALDKRLYSGHDALPLCRTVLDTLGVPLSVESLEDVHALLQLAPTDLSELLTDEALVTQMVGAINSLETLVMTCIEAKEPALAAWAKGLAPQLVGPGKLISKPQDLASALISLPDSKIKLLLRAWSEQLPSVIRSKSDFNQALWYLNDTQTTQVIEAVKDRLPNLIQSASDFTQALLSLSGTQTAQVIAACKETFPSFIQSMRDFNQMKQYLNITQRSQLYEAFKDTLPTLIHSASDFNQALRYLNDRQRSQVYETGKDRLPNLIQSASDFGQVLWHLNNTQRSQIYEAVKDRLPTLIHSASDFGEALHWLTLIDAQTAQVIAAVEDRLPTLIHSAGDFHQVLWHLNNTQRSQIYEAVKDRLPTLIHSASDFNQALAHLNDTQAAQVIKAVKDRLPTLIQSANDLIMALHNLVETRTTQVIEAIKDRLPTLITPEARVVELIHSQAHLTAFHALVRVIKVQMGEYQASCQARLNRLHRTDSTTLYYWAAKSSAHHDTRLTTQLEQAAAVVTYDRDGLARLFEVYQLASVHHALPYLPESGQRVWSALRNYLPMRIPAMPITFFRP